MQSRVQTEIQSQGVVVFSKYYCPFCVQAKDVLKGKGVPFKAIELDQIPQGHQMQDALKTLSGQRTVPNIYIGGTHVGGCDDLMAKISSGTVKSLLNQNNIPNSF